MRGGPTEVRQACLSEGPILLTERFVNLPCAQASAPPLASPDLPGGPAAFPKACSG